MARIIKIDFNKWTTQADKASKTIGERTGKPVSVEYINKLIHKGKLKSLYIPEIGITLVEK